MSLLSFHCKADLTLPWAEILLVGRAILLCLRDQVFKMEHSFSIQVARGLGYTGCRLHLTLPILTSAMTLYHSHVWHVMADPLVISLHYNPIPLQRAFLVGWVAVKSQQGIDNFWSNCLKKMLKCCGSLCPCLKEKSEKDPKTPLSVSYSTLLHIYQLLASPVCLKHGKAEGTWDRACTLWMGA